MGQAIEFNADQFSALFGFVDGLQANDKVVDSIDIGRGPNGSMEVFVSPCHYISISQAGNIRKK